MTVRLWLDNSENQTATAPCDIFCSASVGNDGKPLQIHNSSRYIVPLLYKRRENEGAMTQPDMLLLVATITFTLQ